MASLNFEKEKHAFREFYDSNWNLLENARKTYIRIISSLLNQSDVGYVFHTKSDFRYSVSGMAGCTG